MFFLRFRVQGLGMYLEGSGVWLTFELLQNRGLRNDLTTIVPLKYIGYGVYGDLTIRYPKPFFLST